MGIFRHGCCGVAFRPGVKHRQNQQGQKGGTENTADHHGGQGALHFRTRAGRNRHRHKSEAGHEGAIVIEGTPPLRDAFGNSYQQGPDGQRTVYLAQGGMLMLGEKPGAAEWGALALILCALAVILVPARRPAR